jgi:hypothetical protein
MFKKTDTCSLPVWQQATLEKQQAAALAQPSFQIAF